MHRSGNDFSYVHNLKRGKHAYKFIVDDEWLGLYFLSRYPPRYFRLTPYPLCMCHVTSHHITSIIVSCDRRFAPDQQTVADVEGRINNFVDVSDFAPYVGDDTFFEKCKGRWLVSCPPVLPYHPWSTPNYLLTYLLIYLITYLIFCIQRPKSSHIRL